MDDRKLVIQAQEGYVGAFEELVKRYQAKMFNMALNFVRNREEASDIAQEVFLKAFLALPKFHHKSEFSTWLYRISINHIKDFLRKKKHLNKEISLEDTGDLASSGPDPSMSLEAIKQKEAQQAILYRCLEKLPEKYRLVLNLRDIQGFSYENISEILGVSQGTVDSRLHRARKLLRAKLAPYMEKLGGYNEM